MHATERDLSRRATNTKKSIPRDAFEFVLLCATMEALMKIVTSRNEVRTNE